MTQLARHFWCRLLNHEFAKVGTSYATQESRDMSALTLIVLLILTVGSVLITGVIASRLGVSPDNFLGEG